MHVGLAVALALERPGRCVWTWNKDHVWHWIRAWKEPGLADRLHDACIDGGALMDLLYKRVVCGDPIRRGLEGLSNGKLMAVCQYLADADWVLPEGDWVRTTTILFQGHVKCIEFHAHD